MASGFNTPLDIAKRACQHLGVRQITSFTDTNSVASAEFNSLYDKIRDRELERNLWRFAIRRVILRPITGSSFIWTPPTWNADDDYAAGAVAAYQPVAGTNYPGATGVYYFQTDKALADDSTAPDTASFWHRYVGNVVGDVWSAAAASTTSVGLTTNGYMPGEIVIVPATYAGGTTYALNDIVLYSDGYYYVSLQASNTGHTPSTATTYWQLFPAWIATQGNLYPNFVTGAAVYMSKTSANTQTPSASASQWIALNGTVLNLEIFYPIGTGPAWDLQTQNVLRLPYGFQRIAPSFLFHNDTPFLGANIGPFNDDWVVEGNYAIVDSTSAVMMRCVGGVIDVADMNAMFCEGIAAEMAWNACERITGDATKKADCAKAYSLYMTEARLINAIMEGVKKQPVCEYIAVRA